MKFAKAMRNLCQRVLMLDLASLLILQNFLPLFIQNITSGAAVTVTLGLDRNIYKMKQRY